MNGPRPTDPTTLKRMACDRCHARKLRCLRKTSSTRCSRCMHDGFACTYSPPLKSGRPKKGPLPRESCSRGLSQQASTSSSAESTPFSGTGSDGMSSGITTPLPESACLDTNSNMLNPFTESDFLSQLDLLGSLASSSLPSAHSVGNGNSPPLWLDSLVDADGIAMSDQQISAAKLMNERGAADARHCSGLEASGFARPEPMEPMETGVSDCISEMVQTLCRLQQELIQICGDASKASTHQSSVASSVDTILRPGQELVDTVRRLLEQCAQDHPNMGPRRRLIWDRQTLLPLVFTPLSLLLSMYGEMLREITAALPSSNMTRGEHMNFACTAANHPSTASYRSGERQLKYHDRCIPSPLSSSACFASDRGTTLMSGNLNLSLGGMSLDRPLQLIITTTVIKHHLTQLEAALQTYATCHMQGCDASPSEGFLLSAMAEFRSYTRILIAETSKVV